MNEWTLFNLAGVVGGFIGGWVSAVISRRAARRQREARETEILRICRAEFMYWNESGDDPDADETQQTIAIGAIGASANILSAVAGHPADWHKPGWKRVEPSVSKAEKAEVQ